MGFLSQIRLSSWGGRAQENRGTGTGLWRGSPSLWAGRRDGESREGAARKASSCSFKGEMLPLLILIRQSPEGRKFWGPGNPIVLQICPPQGQDMHST